MNKINELVSRIHDSFNTCVDNTRIHDDCEMWEDYARIVLPTDLTPDEKMELIEKMQNFLHYYNWTNLSNIIKEGENAKFVVVYSTDTGEWWRFEA